MSATLSTFRLAALRVGRMVQKELKQLFRDPKTKGLIFVSPIVQLLLFGYAVDTDVEQLPTFVVDHDSSYESRLLLDAFTSSGHFRVVGTSDRSGDLIDALDVGAAKAGIEIAPGFAAALGRGEEVPIQLLFDGTNSNTATIAQGYAVQIVQEFGTDLAVRERGVRSGVDLRTRAWFNPSLASRTYNVPAVIGVILLLMSLLLTALSVVRERELGTLEQLMVSPLRPFELILGKTIPAAAIALLQLFLVTAVPLLWFDIPMRGSALALLFAAALFILAGLSIGLFISTISSTQQEAFLGMFLFLLPAIILSGFLYPISSMPRVFQYLTLANPLRHFLEVVRGIFLKGAGIVELWPQFLILTTLATLISALAVTRFKRSLA